MQIPLAVRARWSEDWSLGCLLQKLGHQMCVHRLLPGGTGDFGGLLGESGSSVLHLLSREDPSQPLMSTTQQPGPQEAASKVRRRD